MATTTLTRQPETTHELTIPMPKATPTAPPLPPDATLRADTRVAR
jgi:hypothetical protein